VPDRTFIKCSADESRCVEPAALQARIDEEVGAVPRGRAFVRPSGTEDIVRVYAEAETQEAADALADAVGKIVVEFAA
jgi:phosphoacetylglucosamine mutase